MSANVQNMPENTGHDPTANETINQTVSDEQDSDVIDTEKEPDETRIRRKRRKFKTEDVEIARKIRAMAPLGSQIKYSELPLEIRRAVLPTTKLKLVDSGLVEPEYDTEQGILISISILPEKWEEYEDELEAPIVEKAEPKRRTRNILQEDKYKILKLKSENPRRPQSHAWYNWEHCYRDNISVNEYLNSLDYPRDIIVTSKRGRSYFNGPSTIFVTQDLANGNIGIYDSTLPENDPERWLRKEDIETKAAPVEEEEESNTAETTPVPETAAVA